jgi:hypothetical protein
LDPTFLHDRIGAAGGDLAPLNFTSWASTGGSIPYRCRGANLVPSFDAASLSSSREISSDWVHSAAAYRDDETREAASPRQAHGPAHLAGSPSPPPGARGR